MASQDQMELFTTRPLMAISDVDRYTMLSEVFSSSSKRAVSPSWLVMIPLESSFTPFWL